MNFDTWEPVYEAILADMGYERSADEAARDELAALLADSTTIDPGSHSFAGETVAIAAPGPGLSPTSAGLRSATRVVAAGVAADRLRDQGVSVDWVVTDLDGHPDRVGEFTRNGVPVVVHAHGDNRDRLAEYVPTYDPEAVLPTTQAAPAGSVSNFGGFTDGDRAAFLADSLGADRLVFPGWELTDRSVGVAKRRKLRWAARLLLWLERRRGERFSALDGIRGDLDVSMLPVEG